MLCVERISRDQETQGKNKDELATRRRLRCNERDVLTALQRPPTKTHEKATGCIGDHFGGLPLLCVWLMCRESYNACNSRFAFFSGTDFRANTRMMSLISLIVSFPFDERY